ncbi:right-handed parallel beta-helix repeat-containing protein [Altererythrobacter aerius]|uniref:Right-handed parallel beta-helix repeat-containing protein n=1 Tax=Tsuneonella aeria TaxID=1837929 RepID=A0A6I4TE44_9SPHN|nr:right-handed parallel beta-helix repeat-containing protein [Tsuneonella aeria]MXO75581.1 right-handed parallel beta-helix repeat-containing protein [Tsuneonella aeria]
MDCERPLSDRRFPARPSRILLGVIAVMAVAAIPVAAVIAQPAAAPFTVAETGRSFASLQEAVNAIGDGQGTIAIAPGTWRQCAVQERGTVTYATRQPGAAVFDGTACEGKAALVLRGRGARISGLTFRNIKVPDFNGAGIRLEAGDLMVAQSWFLDSEQGILTADNPGGAIVIDQSTFAGLGTCQGAAGCAHSIYTGNYGSLRVTRSRFERGRGGHYLKARSGQVEIVANSFDDSAGTATNYMIDLPAGAAGRITDNWFVQGKDKENYSAFIAVGAEDHLHSSAGLTIAGNDARFAPGFVRTSVFVADWSGDRPVVRENALGVGITAFQER